MSGPGQDARQESPRRGWILYDGGCGFCYRWVHFWEKVVVRRGFALKDLQSAWAEGILRVPREALLDDIRVLTPAGEIVSGADAYLFVARQIWWAWPFYAIFHLPGFRRVIESGYRWFNRNRYHFSRHCTLPERNKPDGTPRGGA
ncbi:MAG: DUF393 domain-containing protein [Acidobacteriia bacterium]|nr:DUF393 domain-containing protein [Terriglobia bacterium]